MAGEARVRVFFPPMIGLAVLGLVSLVLMISIRSGSLTRNLAIGIRTKYTLHSDEAWEAAQRSSRPYLLAISLVAVGHLAALLVVELSGPSEAVGNTLALSGFGVIVIMSLLAGRAANQAAKAVIARSAPPQG